MKAAFVFLAALLPVTVCAQGAVNLPEVTVNASRVANQASAVTFAMPVTALRYEPRVDLHGRNLAEGQADITIRGGIFENTAFQLGALTIVDPQTGHYLAELPVAPAMLAAPDVRTGSDLALGATNTTVGAISHGWRPIRTGGAAAVAVGEYRLRRAEISQGFTTTPAAGAARWGAEVAAARSESDGAVPFGEHEFDRVNVRLQRARGAAQTDLFAGYQGKRFGWPNLYTPFNSNETENLQTLLVALNHRATWGAGEFVEAGAYHRRHKDDYAFNRFAPVGPVHPFQHTTWVSGAAIGGRRALGDLALNFRAEWLTDELESTSLTAGRYRTRSVAKVGLVPEKSWTAAAGSRTIAKAGVSFEDTSRDRGTWSPVLEVAREFPAAALRRVHASYTKTSQMPTYTALNSSATAGLFRGNPNLGRQASHNFEIGASGSLAGWTTQGALFWRRDDGLVDWTFRRGVTARTANAVDIDVGGVELFARRAGPAWDLVIGYTGLTKDADYRGAAVDASFYALNYARHRLTAAVTWRLGHGFELRVDNAARIQADNLLRVIGGRRALSTSVGLAYRPAAWGGVELTVNADNLWDSDFQDVPAVPAAGRQVSAGVSYAW